MPDRRLLRTGAPVALHALLFLGIYQVGYTPAELAHVNAVAQQNGISEAEAIGRVSGWFGYLRYYFHTSSDERLYLEYARLTLHGVVDSEYVAGKQNSEFSPRALPPRAWPYRDLRVEYPPLALIGVVPPALITTDYIGYRFGLGLWLGLLHLLNLFLAWRLSAAGFPGSSRPPAGSPAAEDGIRRLGWWSLAFSVGLGNIIVTRIDHLVVTWILLAAFALERSLQAEGPARARWAAACGALAAAGALTKIVPVLVIPAAVAVLLATDPRQGRRTSVVCVTAAITALCALHLGFWALLGDGYLETYRYHFARGVQIESLYAGFVLLGHLFGLPAQLEHSFGSTNVTSPGLDLVKMISPLLFVACAGFVFLRAALTRRARSVLLLTTLLVLLFMLCSRVLSPQFLIWIAAPLLAIAARYPSQRRLAGLLVLAAVLTQVMYPRVYFLLKGFHPVMVGVLNLRNLLLIGLALQLLPLAVPTGSRPANTSPR
jgi:4-amino-4-deoxy-L-arabinose transferase-like glycosyltransferase